MTYPTIMPALTLDFQNSQQLDPRVKFSRSSSATYINSAGQVASAAEHEARFDHDGNGECLGLLVEEARTNLSEQSEDLNTWWIKHGGVTVTSNATQAPDGLSQADKLVSPNSSNRFSLYKWLALTANKTYTCSCFAKADEWNFFTIAVGKQGGPYTRASYTIDLTTGDVNQGPWQNTPASESFTKTKLSNGWWRLSVSVKVDSTSTDFQFEMGMSPTNQFNNGMAGDGSSGIYMWGAQLEEDFPTSYIPTSGSTVTRSADVAQMTGDNFSSWYNNNESTVVFNAKLFGDKQADLFSFGQAGSNTPFARYLPERTKSRFDIFGPVSWGATTTFWYYIYNTPPVNVSLKGALCLKPGEYRSCLNGVLDSATQSTESIPVFDALNIGKSATGGSVMSGHISRLSYYNQRLTDAELQTLTS